eukprot:CAMPEP_0119300386 /NCGR_PEP_ID=MMETSP1333-20130426/2337_1 /TAXON_ID=418940 /ORGANISM="Scyphosphaera apsteinii, Strain RCC1455" /LENGTH=344 /DNA_ID=CAMNT_0007302139 /DNA_START=123 /DNA_END=1157 /DNA_ORIENTATION=-
MMSSIPRQLFTAQQKGSLKASACKASSLSHDARLTPAEDFKLGGAIRQGKTLYELRKTLRERLARDPSDDEWAAQAQTSVTALHSQLAQAQSARKTLVECNQRLVYWVASRELKRVGRSSQKKDEVVQEGLVALIGAVDQYDPEYGVPFGTYAFLRIRKACRLAALDVKGLIRIPESARREYKKVLGEAARLEQERGSAPSRQVLGEALGLSAERVDQTLERAERALYPSSLNDRFDKWGGDGAERIMKVKAKGAAEHLMQAMRSDLLTLFSQALTPQQARVLVRKYGLDASGSALNNRETARELGISATRVNQLEMAAFVRLRRSNYSELRAYLETLDDEFDI